ncbi:XRE family transcriptional regulator [Streptomyces sp. ISL-96]|uniref:helix-turn-helix domain-containing protein n=1 Tax=Streptomyces sp. ISL-96 TaxID=2819191 RepID=UPI001BE8A0A0|nr:XRE family transcriptional regulator [Streptomyces sp. ISL-96]MBT2491697.1 XRE family transcriptional regulator [Streptomyces sp. ISL-96]
MNTRPSARRRAGVIAGFVLRMARESVPHTQVGMAEALGVDLGTVQGWESGRRALANMKAGALLDLRRRLPALGADPAIVGLLDAAMDADRIISACIEPAEPEGLHPLAGWVHTRDTAHMLAWAINGTTPPALDGRVPAARRGPVAPAPLLGAQDRMMFFDRLRDTAESATRQGERGILLHRQALYLTSYDRSTEAVSWTVQALHARRGVLAARGWTPHWAEARSTAAALARLGDPQPLLDFIERSMADDDDGEAANLNYWAYWLGALPVAQADDRFMRDRNLSGWDPITLLRGLVHGLHQAPGYVDLYVHSLWALLTAYPWLPQASGPLVCELEKRTGQFLDGGGISTRSRRELVTIHYVLRERHH